MESVKEINTSITQRFEQQAEKFPDKIALQSRSQSITYSELNSYANQIAHTLLGIDETPLVGTYFDHNIDSIAAILGILKSGKAYLPINPRYKGETISRIIESSKIRRIVTERNYSDCFAENVAPIDVTSNRKNGYANPEVRAGASDPCCVIYTSGSTGEPKGVLHSHRNVLHTAEVYSKQLSIVSEDKILLLSHCSFSANMANVFVSLVNGATNFIFDVVNEDLLKLPVEMVSNKVTVFHSVPSIFLHLVGLLSPSESFANIRLVLLGGESVNSRHFEMYKKHFPAAKEFAVVYGATEAVGAAFFSTNHAQEHTQCRLPVGYPVEDFSVEIVDSSRQKLPRGQSGEIRITSEFVSLGYFDDRRLTLDSFEEIGSRRAYYTGDIGYLDETDCLYHLGRKDSVVKISGQKVSLLDVEAHLMLHDSIKEAVVLPHLDNSSSLVAYLVTPGELNDAELRQWLGKRLPSYMIPAHFIQLNSMPLTTNGKIDRKTLLSNPIPAGNRRYMAPDNAMELKLVGIWKHVLKRENIGVNDNFFELGGQSLLATQLVSRIKQAFSIEMPLRSLFENPTIAELAQQIETIRWVKEAGNPKFESISDNRQEGEV